MIAEPLSATLATINGLCGNKLVGNNHAEDQRYCSKGIAATIVTLKLVVVVEY